MASSIELSPPSSSDSETDYFDESDKDLEMNFKSEEEETDYEFGPSTSKNVELSNTQIMMARKLVRERYMKRAKESCMNGTIIQEFQNVMNFPTPDELMAEGRKLIQEHKQAILNIEEAIAKKICVITTFWKAIILQASKMRLEPNSVKTGTGKMCPVPCCLAKPIRIRIHMSQYHKELNENEVELILKYYDEPQKEKRKIIEIEVEKIERERIRRTRAVMKERKRNAKLDDEEDNVVLNTRIGDTIYVNKIPKIYKYWGICCVCNKKDIRRLDHHLKKHHFKNDQKGYTEALKRCQRLYKLKPTKEVKTKNLIGKIKIETVLLQEFKEFLKLEISGAVAKKRKVKHISNIFKTMPRNTNEKFDGDYLIRVAKSAPTHPSYSSLRASTQRKVVKAFCCVIDMLLDEESCSIQLDMSKLLKTQKFLHKWKVEIIKNEHKEKEKIKIQKENEFKLVEESLKKLNNSSYYKKNIKDIMTRSDSDPHKTTSNIYSVLRTTVILSFLTNNESMKHLGCFNFKEYRSAKIIVNKDGEKKYIYIIKENKTLKKCEYAKLYLSEAENKILKQFVEQVRPYRYTCTQNNCKIFPKSFGEGANSNTCCDELSQEGIYNALKRYSKKCGLKIVLSTGRLRSLNLSRVKNPMKMGVITAKVNDIGNTDSSVKTSSQLRKMTRMEMQTSVDLQCSEDEASTTSLLPEIVLFDKRSVQEEVAQSESNQDFETRHDQATEYQRGNVNEDTVPEAKRNQDPEAQHGRATENPPNQAAEQRRMVNEEAASENEHCQDPENQATEDQCDESSAKIRTVKLDKKRRLHSYSYKLLELKKPKLQLNKID